MAGPLGAERDGHVHAHEPDACRGYLGVVAQSQPAQRLPQLPVGDPRGHDPDPGVGRVDGGVVQVVQGRVLDGQGVSDLVDLALGVDRLGGEQPAVGSVDVALAVDGRDDGVDPARIEVHRAGAVGHVGHDLEAGPQPGGPRQVHRVAPEVQRLAGRPRVEHRDLLVGEGARGGRRDGRTLGCGVVARDHHGTAAGVRAGEHRVPQGVAGAVHPRPLAVEDADDAVVTRVGTQRGQLRSHHRGDGLLLVEGRGQHDGQVRRLLDGPGQVTVVAAHRRARVAADEGRGLQPRLSVGSQLFDREPGQRLKTRHEHRPGVVGVPGGQAVRVSDGQARPPGVSGRSGGAAPTLVRSQCPVEGSIRLNPTSSSPT